jgi:kynureninase
VAPPPGAGRDRLRRRWARTLNAVSPLPDRDEAIALDAADELAGWRDEFAFPPDCVAYLCGNSLGLQPHRARAAVVEVLDHWEQRAVEGHFTEPGSWYRYDEPIAALQGGLVGAAPEELAVANTLSVNLHLLMASFYRPSGRRTKILIEPHTFPSDRYAVAAQAAWHGLDPTTTVVEIPTADPDRLTVADVTAVLDAHDGEIALALLGGVNYYTGQVLPMGELTVLLQAAGVVVGLDLAHAAGNVACDLSAWGVDFAAWCTYKYLNAGPGAVGGYFVHRRHVGDPALVRLAGWWGNDPERRFAMHDEAAFEPRASADGWKVSNPPMLALAPVGASLGLFDEVGLGALRAKSLGLTAYLARLLDSVDGVTSLTPTAPDERGCQISVRVPGDASDLCAALSKRGVIVDARDPDILRFAPAPFYNSHLDCWTAVTTLASLL